MSTESPDQELQDRKVLSLIESANGLVVILRRRLTPGSIEVGPLEEEADGPGVGPTLSLEKLFHLKGIDDKLSIVFERQQDKPGYSGFVEDGKQHLANILGKRIDVLFQQSGVDPATREAIPEDADEMVLKMFRNHPYSTGTWYPEENNPPS